ncbi:MAG: tetratricopeptide repeat protein [Azoarcus sp.]|nr:tetratricopeptide repeat protein [Azoarcus sp.]
MDNAIIAAIIGGIFLIAAAFVTGWFQKRQNGKTGGDRSASPVVKAGKRAKTGEININSPHYNTIINVSQETGVPLETLRGILKRMGETELVEADPKEIEQRLRAKAEQYLSLEKQLRVFTGNDPEVEHLRKIARQALQEDRLQEVENLLAQARQHVRAARQELRDAEQTQRKVEAEIVSEQAAAARLCLNAASYRKAAGLFGEAADLIALDDAPRAREYQLQRASALDDLGDEFGDNDALREAIALYRKILSGIDRATDPLAWARTWNNLGNALRTLGERESSTARLEEAVAAYREALKEYTRERVPLDWATTQNNLGAALFRLGERESGTARLEQAVAAYREALKEYTRERVPLDWAMTQNNLGSALFRLDEWESGTARLEEAVAAYREALKEYTRERVPLNWAMTQNNLGNVLQTLGERESGTARLEQALDAYNNALAVFEESGPSHYAELAQDNLARAQALLRDRKGGSALPTPPGGFQKPPGGV